MNTNKIKGKSGERLQNYKVWYHALPKVLRAALLPGAIGATFIIIKYVLKDESVLNYLLIPFLAVLFVFNTYNQYLDSLLEGDLEKEKEEKKNWMDATERYMYLNTVLRYLVEAKSLMFLRTIDTYDSEGKEKAVQDIRNQNSFEVSLSRIIDSIRTVFEERSDKLREQKFRVTFLSPNEAGTHLECKAYSNQEGAQPRSLNGDTPNPFAKGGSTAGGLLWSRDGINYSVVEDTDKEVNSQNPGFKFLRDGQENHLKAILCYKIYDHQENSLLGIICVDTNIDNAFNDSIRYHLNVLEAFGQRIIFEARFAYMKDKLQRNSGDKLK